jgi:hypothetical protein
VQIEPLNGYQSAVAHSEAVRPHSCPLGEHPHFWPGRIPSWAPGFRHDVGLADEVKKKDHTDMRKRVESGYCVYRKSIAVEPDDGIDLPPIIVDCLGATSNNDADGLQGDHDDPS